MRLLFIDIIVHHKKPNCEAHHCLRSERDTVHAWACTSIVAYWSSFKSRTDINESNNLHCDHVEVHSPINELNDQHGNAHSDKTSLTKPGTSIFSSVINTLCAEHIWSKKLDWLISCDRWLAPKLSGFPTHLGSCPNLSHILAINHQQLTKHPIHG